MSDIVESLRWWAYKFCGKGAQEDDASDVMTNAIHEIEKLREALTNATTIIDSLYAFAECNTMLTSMRKNRACIEETIMKPARAALGEKE
jgi:hypothetical protein